MNPCTSSALPPRLPFERRYSDMRRPTGGIAGHYSDASEYWSIKVKVKECAQAGVRKQPVGAHGSTTATLQDIQLLTKIAVNINFK
jgi:hypothetical protein